MLQNGTILNNRYRIDRVIGHGGMSTVYGAVDEVNGNRLAVKEALKNAKMDNQTVSLGLAAEGKLLKSLSNPHLPKIYDVLEDDESIRIVMDFIPAPSLDKVVISNGAMDMDMVLEIGIQVCEVLEYLHLQNPPIIYRDLKPSNLLIKTKAGEEKNYINIFLIDFGTARTYKTDTSRTSDTILIGTEGFAAPEQYGGYGQSDARTDIFCLGATLFNLITGHSPYEKPAGVTPLGKWKPELAGCPLDKIIQKCTASDPNERFQTAAELKMALENANKPGKTGFFKDIWKPKQKKTWEEVKTPAVSAAASKHSKSAGNAVQGSKQSPANPPVKQKTPQISEPVEPEVNEDPDEEYEEGMQQVYRMLTVISLSVAIACLVFGLIFLLSGVSLAAYIALVICGGAVILGVVGAVLYLNEG